MIVIPVKEGEVIDKQRDLKEIHENWYFKRD